MLTCHTGPKLATDASEVKGGNRPPRKAKGATVKPRKKVNSKVKTETKEAPKGASASAAPAPARPQKIKVLKADTKFRGAREAWFNRLKEFDGKTEGEYLESCRTKPPALTKNGTAENPSGWVRYFTRTGVASLHV